MSEAEYISQINYYKNQICCYQGKLASVKKQIDEAEEALREARSYCTKFYNFVDDNKDKSEKLIVDNGLKSLLGLSNHLKDMLIGKYKNMNVCVILGEFENANVPYAVPEIFKRARDAKRFMFFDDMANMKILNMPLAVLRQFKKPIDLGDDYYIKDNNCLKIKTVQID